MVKASCDTAQSCGGVVVGLSGYTLTVLWNASKRCSGHTLAGLNFAAQLRQRASKAMRIGISSGSVLHGNVGTQKHRFSTVFGVTLDVASSVADLAHTLGSFCLFADCTPTGRALDSSVQGCCRLIDMWYATEEKQKIQVMQVDEKMLLQKIGVWEEDSTEGLQRSREQGTHIQRYCAKPGTVEAQESLSTLAGLAAKNNDSLLRVCACTLFFGWFGLVWFGLFDTTCVCVCVCVRLPSLRKVWSKRSQISKNKVKIK